MTYKTSVRTIFNSLAALAARFEDPLRLLPNSTLNQKWGFQDGATPYDGEIVRSKYFIIGLGGVDITFEQGLYRYAFRNYQPGQASLYLPIPQIMRRVQDSMDAATRAKYRGLQFIEKNGVVYESYMLRPLPKTNLPADAETRRVVNGIIQADAWTPTLEELNPKPLTLNANQQVTGDRTFLAASKKMDVQFSATDIQEILNVVNILYGDIEFADISEFGIVQGVDRQVRGDFNGVTTNYTEAIYAQMADFLRVRFSAPDSLGGKTIHIDAGSSDPLGIRSITA